jgi:FkbM family methyltransferase
LVSSVSQWEKWLIDELPKGGDIALDVGAHVGEWAIDLAERFRSVVCFEPHPIVFKKLTQNVGRFSNVSCVRIAVLDSDCAKTFQMYVTDTHSGFYETIFTKRDKLIGSVTVGCVSLDTLEFDGKVDFIKIDVEGAEVDVLNGALELIRHDKPQLLIEIHGSENGKKVLWTLDNLAYDVPITIHSPRDRVGSEFWSEHFWISS